MKRALAFILILIFTYNIIGGYVAIMIEKHFVRREMIENITRGVPLSKLTSITMTSKNKNEFNWRDDHEFSYKGMLYDVVRTEKVDPETTVYHCLADRLETKLLTDLEKQKNKNSKQDKNSPLKQVVKLVFKVEPETLGQQTVLTISKTPINNFPVNFYDSRSLEISSPPPNYM